MGVIIINICVIILYIYVIILYIYAIVIHIRVIIIYKCVIIKCICVIILYIIVYIYFHIDQESSRYAESYQSRGRCFKPLLCHSCIVCSSSTKNLADTTKAINPGVVVSNLCSAIHSQRCSSSTNTLNALCVQKDSCEEYQCEKDVISYGRRDITELSFKHSSHSMKTR